MITQQSHERYLQLLKMVTGPLKLTGSTKVGKVSTMNHEIEGITAAIDIINLTLQIIQPLVRIADHSKTDCIFRLYCSLNLLNIGNIQISIAVDLHIIRMNIEDGIAGCHHTETTGSQDIGNNFMHSCLIIFKNSFFITLKYYFFFFFNLA